jgi:hypothetical protein
MQWEHNNLECQFFLKNVVNYLQICNHVNFRNFINISKNIKGVKYVHLKTCEHVLFNFKFPFYLSNVNHSFLESKRIFMLWLREQKELKLANFLIYCIYKHI